LGSASHLAFAFEELRRRLGQSLDWSTQPLTNVYS